MNNPYYIKISKYQALKVAHEAKHVLASNGLLKLYKLQNAEYRKEIMIDEIQYVVYKITLKKDDCIDFFILRRELQLVNEHILKEYRIE